ncbi:MAG: MFS transporter [Proteobacteria bacterium]|nr:MFS transporter [Pseudomonadota bacterium]
MVKRSQQGLLISAISLGTLLEWAEYTFYGYMAVLLSGLFFPENDASVALLKTYGIFAAGYLMRPLGAIVFGHIGDSIGRKKALMISLFIMGGATFTIGCLPTYQQIGVLAPFILLIMRMLQGFAISGEYNGAGIFLVEKIGQKNPCLAGSWISASAAFGMVLGGIAAFATSLPSAPLWAWRVPFLLGGTSCFVGFWLRATITEAKTHPPVTLPLMQVFKQHKKSLSIVAAIAAFTGIFVYICNIYIVAFLHQQVMLPTHHASFFAIFGEIIVTILIPVMAWVADKTCPYRQYRWGLFLVALGCPFIFELCALGNYPSITLAMILYGVLNAIVCGPMVKILYDQFPVSVRYTGVSLGWSFSAAIFCGSAPMVAQYLTNKFEWTLGPSLYVSLISIITLMMISFLLPNPSLATTYRLKQLTD